LFQCQQITYKKTRFRILALFIPFSSKLKISHASRIRAFLIVMMMMDAGMGKRERERKKKLLLPRAKAVRCAPFASQSPKRRMMRGVGWLVEGFVSLSLPPRKAQGANPPPPDAVLYTPSDGPGEISAAARNECRTAVPCRCIGRRQGGADGHIICSFLCLCG
jgi:hypothetical protein